MDLGRLKITDDALENFKGIHTLKFNGTHATDKGLEHLDGIKFLCVKDGEKITDNGLEHLKGINSLSLTGCINITDQGGSHLKGIHSLNLDLRSCLRSLTKDLNT